MLKFRAVSPSPERRVNARNVSTDLLPYGGITYFINSFDYPNLLESKIMRYLWSGELNSSSVWNFSCLVRLKYSHRPDLVEIVKCKHQLQLALTHHPWNEMFNNLGKSSVLHKNMTVLKLG